MIAPKSHENTECLFKYFIYVLWITEAVSTIMSNSRTLFQKHCHQFVTIEIYDKQKNKGGIRVDWGDFD